MRLMISEIAWNSSRMKPSRMNSLDGQMMTAGVGGHFLALVRINHERHAERDHHQHQRQQHQDVTEQIDPLARALRQAAGDDVDPDMAVALEHMGGGQHEDGAEQVPLQLQPGVGADIEQLANDRVGRADQNGGENEPADVMADEARHRVDHAADSQERLHD